MKALKIRSILCNAIIMISTGIAPLCGAQVLEEVIVTAEKRAESVQDVSIAITAFSEDAIRKAGLIDIESLQQKVPGLSFEQTYGRPFNTLRGVSSGTANLSSDAGIVVYVDGLPSSSLTGQLGTQADLQRIEVLRGPQGTLYGRNAVGGAINYWTKVPEGEVEGSITAHLGDVENGEAWGVEGGVSFPMIEDVLSARISGSWHESDGNFRNVIDIPNDPVTGLDDDESENIAVKLVLNWTPTGNLQFITRANYSKYEYAGPAIQQVRDISSFAGGFGPIALGGLQPEPFTLYANDRPTGVRIERFSISETISWDISDVGFLGDINIKSITGYQDFEWKSATDAEGTDYNVGAQSYFNPTTGLFDPRNEDFDVITQEVVVTSQNDTAFEWTAGLFYFKQEGDEFGRFVLGDGATFVPGFEIFGEFDLTDLEVESLGIFAQGTYSVTDWARLTAGIRYTDETKESNNNVFFFAVCSFANPDLDYSEWTPHFGLDFDLAEDVLLYGKVTRGFRSGGWNIAGCDPVNNFYDPEKMWSYEVGIKSRLLDNSLQVNLAAFYLDYSGYQVGQNTSLGVFEFVNFPAEVYGFEYEIDYAPMENLALSVGGSFMDTELDSVLAEDAFFGSGTFIDIGGNQLPRAPKTSVNAAIDYLIPTDFADVTLHYDIHHRTKQHITYQNLPFETMPGYSIMNAWINFENLGGGDSGWNLQVYINNLTDKEYLTGMSAPNPLFGALGHYGNPRTWGARVTYNF